MADRPPVPAPNLTEKREQTIQVLIRSFAADRLAVEDFEGRLDRAHRARDAATLDSLTADLAADEAPAATTVPAPRRPAPPPASVRERQVLAAVLGGVERKGVWTPARRTTAVAILGGLHLDFREAALGPGVTEVDIFAMMGGTEIIVPPGLIVDSDGVAILGGWEHGPGRDPSAEPEAPVLRITGLTLLGGVEIKVREPGESARDAHRRRKAERRLRRQQRRIRDGS
ncbi:MAG: hypothetical protein PVH00_11990 [Gemmatimonadota bacterium]|jgi:hypothetical protein